MPVEGINVFFDDSSYFLDFDHLRREIAFVNWVRDRQDADLHILGTSQMTGGGGQEITFAFIGRRALAGKQDTLHCVLGSTDTSAERRDQITDVLKLGLVRWAVDTPAAEGIVISYRGAQRPPEQRAVTDPWNAWVFRVSASGLFNGESQSSSGRYSGSFSANRTTEAFKFALSASGSYSRSEYDIPGVLTYVNTTRSFSARMEPVWSLSDHWSAGLEFYASRSTYLNQILTYSGGPAIEYNFYPWSESTRRQLTLYYSVGASSMRYEEETIFGVTEETVGRHALTLSSVMQEPWGNVNGSLTFSQYLHDADLHSISLFGFTDVRIFRGLSVNFSGGASRIRDQLSLSAAGLTPEDIVSRRRQLATDYNYFFSVGLSFRFGSIYNNAVNPRMR